MPKDSDHLTPQERKEIREQSYEKTRQQKNEARAREREYSTTVYGSKISCDKIKKARDVVCKEYTDGMMASNAGSFSGDMMKSTIDRQRCKEWSNGAERCKSKVYGDK